MANPSTDGQLPVPETHLDLFTSQNERGFSSMSSTRSRSSSDTENRSHLPCVTENRSRSSSTTKNQSGSPCANEHRSPSTTATENRSRSLCATESRSHILSPSEIRSRSPSPSAKSTQFTINTVEDSESNSSDDNSFSSFSSTFNDAKTEWRSIYTAAILSFISSVQFSLYLSSMWPYMQMVDKRITENFFGLVVSAFSIGQIVSSPLFGYWSNQIKKVTPPLILGLSMMLLGNALYLLMPMMPFPNRYLLLIGRLVTGIGAGNTALLRTYASTASTANDRSRAIAFVTCGQALGIVVGPVFQLVFTPLGFPGFALLSQKLRFNLYTAPAYFACLMNIVGMSLLKYAFTEKYVGIVTTTKKVDSESDLEKQDVEEVEVKIPKYDQMAVVICYATRFVDVFVRTNLETLGSAFAMMMFSMNENESVTYNSAAQGFVGFLTFVTYVVYICFHLDKHINMRVGCIASLLALVLFHLLTFSWPFLPALQEAYDPDDTAIGCNYGRFDWCVRMNAVNVYLYYGSYAIVIGLAFPLLNITMNTLFSRILGPRRQGTEQGILQGAGGLARLVGPLAGSALYSAWGPRPVWAMIVLVIVLVLLAWARMYSRMVPFEARLKRRQSAFSCASEVTMVRNDKSDVSNEEQ
ncbi:unnamed protein product [Bursaphelenchus okinawaensis]|uniref:Major facilitator superfamily (MFS) profile domain-containing protein n=1 Tax=Bursaphelenchus okinawaensis TaxID=465554 RepID=A0A811KBC0_9BILA|nr:unnamed protein product [Bursaphelenchus okinawaensis]CAG9098914.1 unnamed protein product [Bursaphelenchus okinawaensis]